MEAALAQPVNLVNAMALARDRGIAIEEATAEEPGDFGTLVEAEVTTSGVSVGSTGLALHSESSGHDPSLAGRCRTRSAHARARSPVRRAHVRWISSRRCCCSEPATACT